MLILGSFGHGNFGDDIIPLCLEQALLAVNYATPLRILSRFNNPKLNNSLPYSSAEAREILSSRDPLFVVGGGVIEPRKESCLNRALLVAKDLNPVVPIFNSVEPGVRFSYVQRRKVRKVLRKLPFQAGVRDCFSAETLRAVFGVDQVSVTGDLGLWISDLLSNKHPKSVVENKLVFITNDTYPNSEYVNFVSNLLFQAFKKYKVSIHLMSISPYSYKEKEINNKILEKIKEKDNGITIEIENIYGLSYPDYFFNILNVMKSARHIISLRLHGLVAAYSLGVPFSTFCYHPKVFSFLQTMNSTGASMNQFLPNQQAKNHYGFSFSDAQPNLANAIRVLETRIDEKPDVRLSDNLKERQLNYLSGIKNMLF